MRWRPAGALCRWSAFWDMTLYRLRTMGEEEYAALPDCGEGLWKRVMRYGRQCASYQELIMGIKTKRYALSRVRRILLAHCWE